MFKDFITDTHTINRISKEELRIIKKELVHRHVAWLTALRYQMREDKPWEMHIKKQKSNVEFRSNAFRVCEDEMGLKDAIRSYLSEADFNEIFTKGNKASQLLGIQSRRLKELMDSGLIEDFRHMEMANVLVELYTLQGQSERIKIFPTQDSLRP